MRLGELLVADGRLSEEQVEQGRRAQVLWGGRLGTNLVELGLLDLDELSWALARLHRVPVALARHFAQLDPVLQQRLGPDLAEKWRCVPLARLADDPPRVGIAATSPLPDEAIAEIAAQLGEAREAIVVAIAAEMRILYHLELSYGIGRPARYMRAPDGVDPPPPPPVLDENSETEVELPPAVEPVVEEVAIAEATTLTLATPDGEVATGPEHRRYMPMVGDEERRVGRIAIRRVVVYADEVAAARPPGTWPEVLRAIRRAHDRDRVGELAVSALTAFCPRLQVAVLLVVRGQVAIGWQGRHRHGALDVRSIAVPLDQPSGISEAVSTGTVVAREVRDDAEPWDIDQRLAAALGTSSGAQTIIFPISLSELQVACVLYCQLEPDAAAGSDGAAREAAGGGGGGDGEPAGPQADSPDAGAAPDSEELIASVVASMRSAFLRMIRAASR